MKGAASKHWYIAATIGLACVAASRDAAAQSAMEPTGAHDARPRSAQDAAAAEALFDQAKQLMRDKKYAQACPKFAESNRLDAGIGTMLWLADCYEKNGQYASAWAEFADAADAAAQQHDEREKVAREHAVALEASLSKVTIGVPPGSDVVGLQVTRDGVTVARALWGTPLPVDPGTHSLAATAPGKKPWHMTLEVAALSRSGVVTVPVLEDEGSPASPATPGLGEPGPPPSEAAPSATDEAYVTPAGGNRGGVQRIGGLVVAGVGVVGIGVGSVFGLQAKSHLDDSNAAGHCLPDNHCDGPGTDARNQAISVATLSTVAFVAGGALIAGGMVLYFVAPRSSSIQTSAQRRVSPVWSRLEVSPMIGQYERGVSLRGNF
jgi:hypothetical protein